MKITIKQIAEMAGVHRSTVDKVLHNREGVSEEVRKRIQKIIEEYDYKPNPIGQALKMQKKTIRIGIILLKVDAEDIIREGIQRELGSYQSFNIQTDYHSVLYPDIKGQLKLIHQMIEEKVDGIILSPINSEEIVNAINYCMSMKIPVVTVNSDIKGSQRFCFIGQDGSQAGKVAGRLMGEFLNGKGSVAVLTSDGDARQSFFFDKREGGFRGILDKEYPRIHTLKSIRTDEDPEIIAAETKKLLESEKKLDGIFITCGGVKEVGKVLKKEKREDIKVICYEDYSEVLDLVKERVVDVTIATELKKQGGQALNVMLDYLIYEKTPPRKHLYTEIKIILKECIE